MRKVKEYLNRIRKLILFSLICIGVGILFAGSVFATQYFAVNISYKHPFASIVSSVVSKDAVSDLSEGGFLLETRDREGNRLNATLFDIPHTLIMEDFLKDTPSRGAMVEVPVRMVVFIPYNQNAASITLFNISYEPLTAITLVSERRSDYLAVSELNYWFIWSLIAGIFSLILFYFISRFFRFQNAYK